MPLRRKHPLLGENVAVTVRYGFAIVRNTAFDQAAICLPTVSRHRIVFDHISWHRTESEAMAVISAMNLAGITPEMVREDMKRERKRKKAQGAGAEPQSDEPSTIAEAISAAERLADARSRILGEGEGGGLRLIETVIVEAADNGRP